MKTIKDQVYAGAFVTEDMALSNAYLIVSDRITPADVLKDLENHTGYNWVDKPIYSQDLNMKDHKQKVLMNRMMALVEVRNSIEEDEFEFIRFH